MKCLFPRLESSRAVSTSKLPVLLSEALILLVSIVDRIRKWQSMYDNRLLFTSISLDVTI
jgi:hypothetical protein